MSVHPILSSAYINCRVLILALNTNLNLDEEVGVFISHLESGDKTAFG